MLKRILQQELGNLAKWCGRCEFGFIYCTDCVDVCDHDKVCPNCPKEVRDGNDS